MLNPYSRKQVSYLQINSALPLHFAFIDQKLCWSTYQDLLVKIYDFESKKVNVLDLAKYKFIDSKIQSLNSCLP